MTNDSIKYNAYWQVIADRTGYDFSGYSPESLNRRLINFISDERIGSSGELHDLLGTDQKIHEKILGKLLVGYSEMFRDPEFFQSLKCNVLQALSACDTIKIWHVGCSTGEEVYSLAILLHEMNLLHRCEIHASDINENNLKNAAAGIYPLQRMQEATSRYVYSGGRVSLSEYYTAFYEHVIFHSFLKERISFIKHDMLIDRQENKFHLILCRNVLIYFNQQNQAKGVKLLAESLRDYGFIGMGINELVVNPCEELICIDKTNKIFRKKFPEK